MEYAYVKKSEWETMKARLRNIKIKFSKLAKKAAVQPFGSGASAGINITLPKTTGNPGYNGPFKLFLFTETEGEGEDATTVTKIGVRSGWVQAASPAEAGIVYGASVITEISRTLTASELLSNPTVAYMRTSAVIVPNPTVDGSKGYVYLNATVRYVDGERVYPTLELVGTASSPVVCNELGHRLYLLGRVAVYNGQLLLWQIQHGHIYDFGAYQGPFSVFPAIADDGLAVWCVGGAVSFPNAYGVTIPSQKLALSPVTADDVAIVAVAITLTYSETAYVSLSAALCVYDPLELPARTDTFEYVPIAKVTFALAEKESESDPDVIAIKDIMPMHYGNIGTDARLW